MVKNVKKDISQLCSISETNLDGLNNQLCDLISHYIYCARETEEKEIQLDIGIGLLIIMIYDKEVRYKFLPSKSMEKAVIDGYKSRNSVLIEKADKSIGQRINKTYKELL